LVFSVFLIACEPENPADLVLYNGNVLTVDTENSVAQAIAVSNGRIVAVGSTDEILDHAGRDTARVDLGGKTVIPGIVDAHTHLRGIAGNVGKLVIADANSVAEVLEIISQHAATVPAGTWIETATGWQPTNFEENRMPTRQELDQAAPGHPVFLKKGYQNGVVNSLALESAGITPESAKDNFLRDEAGELTGAIYGSLNEITAAQPPISDEQVVQTYIDGMQLLNRYGMTALRDAALAPAQVGLLRQLADEGKLSLRINGIGQIYPPTPLQVDKRMWSGIEPYRSDWFTHDTLKIVADGGISDALLREEYAWNDDSVEGYKGRYVTQMDKIKAVAEWACESGRKLAVHTIGDAMIDSLLDHYESINDSCATGELGWTIEHVALVTPDQADRIKALGLKVTTQTGLNYSLAAAWRKYWGEERMARSVPNRMLIDKGLMPGGGTDANTGPANPFVAIWADVTRQTRVGVIGVEQAVTPAESLRMHTIWAARIMGLDDKTGSIEVGKYADLAVLDRDILSVPHDDIKDTQVMMTFVEGNLVFER
jgi:predicted amidohydrolase YtcJ